MPLDPVSQQLAIQSYKEDLGEKGDCTTDLLIEKDRCATACIVAKESGVISGQEIAQFLFEWVSPSLKYHPLKRDGEAVLTGETIATMKGLAWVILQVERTALNFLQILSGIATTTQAFIKRMKTNRVILLDTRKTIPTLRFLQKKAVCHGGGTNHRFGLYDQILIKENHLMVVSQQRGKDIDDAIIFSLQQAKKNHCKNSFVEIEVQNQRQAILAAKNGADIILLDNMTLNQWKKSVQSISCINPRVLLEASGNIRLCNIERIAQTGVDRISSGSLTSRLKSFDLSLLITPSRKKT